MRRAFDYITSDPASSPAHLNLGLAYMRLERFGQAERHVDLAVRIDPHSAGAFLVRGMLWEG